MPYRLELTKRYYRAAWNADAGGIAMRILSVCPSVCQTRDLWQNERMMCQDPSGPIRGTAVFSRGTGLVSIDTARSRPNQRPPRVVHSNLAQSADRYHAAR